jgi:IclR family transcriptional regulator, KDG regulon repressor
VAPPAGSADPTEGAELHRDDRATPSVLKATAILGVLAEVGGRAPLSHVARTTGQAKSTAHRVLAQLIEAGLVERAGAEYAIAPALFEIAAQAAGGRYRTLTECATPYMAELHERTGCTVHLATLTGTDALYLQKIHGRHGTSTPTGMGVRLPAYCTAIGKALLSEDAPAYLTALAGRPLHRMTRYSHRSTLTLRRDLHATGERGYALSDEEACLGLACVATPVRDADGVAVAALSLSVARGRFDERRLTAAVTGGADAIAAELRARR